MRLVMTRAATGNLQEKYEVSARRRMRFYFKVADSFVVVEGIRFSNLQDLLEMSARRHFRFQRRF
jgi:hypothetical protein